MHESRNQAQSSAADKLLVCRIRRAVLCAETPGGFERRQKCALAGRRQVLNSDELFQPASAARYTPGLTSAAGSEL